MHTTTTGQKVRFIKAARETKDGFLAHHTTVGRTYEVTVGPRSNGEVCILGDQDVEIWLLPGEWESA